MDESRRFLILGGVAGALLALGGCSALPTREEMRARSAAKFADKALLAAFYPDPMHRQYDTFDIDESAIEFEKVTSLGTSSTSVAENKYLQVSEVTDDIAQRYVGVATGRGNKVRLYKAAVNGRIARLFRLDPYVNTPARTDLDYAMIEFDGSDRMVSVLYRFAYLMPDFANTYGYARRFSHIFVDRAAMRAIENALPNAFLAENELRSAS